MGRKLVPARIRWSAVAAILLVATWCLHALQGARQGPGVAAAQEGGTASARRPIVLDRAPVRSIADPNPVFRAIAIDTERGEVFIANDKESAGTSILVYPTQFPPHG